jgi:hypothetical protein
MISTSSLQANNSNLTVVAANQLNVGDNATVTIHNPSGSLELISIVLAFDAQISQSQNMSRPSVSTMHQSISFLVTLPGVSKTWISYRKCFALRTSRPKRTIRLVARFMECLA